MKQQYNYFTKLLNILRVVSLVVINLLDDTGEGVELMALHLLNRCSIVRAKHQTLIGVLVGPIFQGKFILNRFI
jgi:hypothetical protein